MEIDKHQNAYVGLIDNKIVGYVSFYYDEDSKSAEIYSLYCDETYQGKGFGKAMMNFAFEIIKTQVKNFFIFITI